MSQQNGFQQGGFHQQTQWHSQQTTQGNAEEDVIEGEFINKDEANARPKLDGEKD